MSDDRELVERLAAIDAIPRASWIAELRADLDAAWETEDAGYLGSLHETTVTLVDHEPATLPISGRRWPILIAAAAVALVAFALVVFDGDDSEIEVPAAPPSTVSSTSTVDTSLTKVVDPWSPELTAQRLGFPIACDLLSGLCPNVAISPEGTLVALDRRARTLTWYEDEPRVVPLAAEPQRSLGTALLIGIGPYDIAYIVTRANYVVAVAPSGAQITGMAFTSHPGPMPAYATAAGLIAQWSRWPSPNAAPDVQWVDLDGNPITDTRSHPTAKATDAGIEVRLGEKEWLLTNDPGIRALDFLPRPDGGVVIVFDIWQASIDRGARVFNLFELSPDGTIERYFIDTEARPMVLPDGSLIVEYNLQLVRLTPPA